MYRDDALVGWLDSRGERRERNAPEWDGIRDGQDCPSHDHSVDDAFAALGVELVPLA
jgi:hypothetical protein